ncbi:mechanosensitive ion channel family protein [Ostreiculturibacter nitratireducens]|uniref:mechanosensitive ion channel family protein n=1 Tax=Ostreiculturibacter nitratireducens TaxID=3075226 RepID=UPI0031B5D11D
MRRTTFTLFLALGLLALASPALKAQETAPTEPAGTISVGDTAADDLQMAARIRDILAELDGYGGVTVSVRAGIVTLAGEVADQEALSRLDPLIARVEGVVAIENNVRQSTDIAERLSPAVERLVDRFQQVADYGPLLLVAALVAGLVAGFGFWIARLRRFWERVAPNTFIADVLRTLVRLFFSVAAVVVALDILGATALLGTFLGAAGIVGLALGFAVRDPIENFIASVMLSLRQPFRPNDLVEIEGDTGRVIRLTSRATILLSLDGNHIRIPNSTVFKARIVNFTQNAERRFSFLLGVDASADLVRVREIGVEALRSLPFVLESPAPSGWVERVGDSNVEITFTGWVDQTRTDFPLARSEAIRVVKGAIEASGFALPEPIYRVILESPEEEAAAAKPPAPPRREKARPSEAVLDTSHDSTLEDLVHEERRVAEDDLLSPEAPKE